MMGKTNILVLDDDPTELELIKMHFDKGGVTNYEMFTEVELFFEHFTEDVYLAVIDYRLGGTTAIKVTDRIHQICQQRKSLATCEIIVISGTTDIRVPVYFINSKKANYFLIKDNEGEYYYELVVYAQKAINRQHGWAELERKQMEKIETYKHLSVPDEGK